MKVMITLVRRKGVRRGVFAVLDSFHPTHFLHILFQLPQCHSYVQSWTPVLPEASSWRNWILGSGLLMKKSKKVKNHRIIKPRRELNPEAQLQIRGFSHCWSDHTWQCLWWYYMCFYKQRPNCMKQKYFSHFKNICSQNSNATTQGKKKIKKKKIRIPLLHNQTKAHGINLQYRTCPLSAAEYLFSCQSNA